MIAQKKDRHNLNNFWLQSEDKFECSTINGKIILHIIKNHMGNLSKYQDATRLSVRIWQVLHQDYGGYGLVRQNTTQKLIINYPAVFFRSHQAASQPLKLYTHYRTTRPSCTISSFSITFIPTIYIVIAPLLKIIPTTFLNKQYR